MGMKPDQGAVDPRPYLVKITRYPIPAGRREALKSQGKLPVGWESRLTTVTDFVEVQARNDLEAISKAREATTLVVAGEEVTFHESRGDGTFRRLHPRNTDLLNL
jgi:hypothetical protein